MRTGTAIRRGTIVAVPLSLVLLSGAPAFAATLAPGDACTTSDSLDAGLSCVNGIVTTSTAPSPDPAASGSGTGTAPDPSQSPSSSPTTEPPAAGSIDPSVPSLPSTGGTGSGGSTSGGTASGGTTSAGSTTGGTGGISGTTTPALVAPATAASTPTSTTAAPATSRPTAAKSSSAGTGGQQAPASTLLAAADLAMAPPGDLPSLAAVRSFTVRRVLDPGAVQSPELAAGLPLAGLPPMQKVAAVQGPLLAVGQEAAGGGGFRLLGVDSRSLPGILIALATGLVAAIGAGNVRVWQSRLAARRRPMGRHQRAQALTS